MYLLSVIIYSQQGTNENSSDTGTWWTGVPQGKARTPIRAGSDVEVADRQSDATKPPAAGVPHKIKEVKIMSSNEMDSKIKELRELRRMAEELAAEIDSIQDTIKRHMDAEGVDTISGTDWRVTYKAVTSARLDTAALKKALPDLAAQFTKTTTARRFCVA